jgi:protein SCO1
MMTPRPFRLLIWGTLPLLLFAMIATLWLYFHQEVDARDIALNYPLPEFVLTNQDNHRMSLADLRGQVWVGDIVFTRCAGPCPIMTGKLSGLQKDLFKGDAVKFVTLTTDPEFDSPEMMKRFGERFNADFKKWYFLTGDKKQIARLAVDGMKLVAIEKSPQERENDADLFIHSTRFVVVDKNGIVRASFDSTEPETPAKLVKAVHQLLLEPANPQLSSIPH